MEEDINKLVENYQSTYNYNEMISPSILFKSIEEVTTFVNIPCTVEDLNLFLKRCEEEELYEYCIVVKNKLYKLNQTVTSNENVKISTSKNNGKETYGYAYEKNNDYAYE